ncbi:hypothetical protein FDECE_4431 [Fusarium decemcellulare]|nr:hypothetical protein FDECE_4431 [Fusarium decemcellulare]
MVARKRKIESRPKVRTGCGTCRIRKIKCDENKPFCQKCVKTGRTCEGYESPFRPFTNQPAKEAHAGIIKPDKGLQPIRPTSAKVTLEDIDLLNHYFSTKTIFNVKLGCNKEARQILQASLTDPPIQHAVSSLKALREHLEVSRNAPTSIAQQSPSYDYGLEQYSMALRGLASQLSSPDSNGLKSALLCCQVLISVEQVRANFSAMALHIIRGLRIMHEYRARPHFVAADKLAPAQHSQLPLLDVFIIKLFAAPCKFAEHLATADVSGAHQQSTEPVRLCKIAPNMRTELVRIATSTLELLAKVSQVESVENALGLLSKRSTLLDCLESWLSDLEDIQPEMGPLDSEPLSVTFMRLFHLILKIVLLGALDSSPDLDAKLRTENDQLQDVANIVGERVRAYTTRTTSIGMGEEIGRETDSVSS